MSYVDTSIGFSLRSEPPNLRVSLPGDQPNLEHYVTRRSNRDLPFRAAFFAMIPVANLIGDLVLYGWPGWPKFRESLLVVPVCAVVYIIGYYVLVRAFSARTLRRIRTAGFDSTVVHLTAEGQWITFRFASGREFVDRWDRLLRFKVGTEFTEFEFPVNPPVIIPTSSISEDTRDVISQFCAAEKIPSETKR